jgi:hypothetical protein
MIAVLCTLILIAGLSRLAIMSDPDLEARAKLCSTYIQYADTTQKPIEAMDKICWRNTVK